jgi:hypothetical protein
MNELRDKSREQLERLRSQLVVDPTPQAKIQLERVIAELRRKQSASR